MYGITLHYSQQIKSQIIMDSDITMHSDKKTIQNYMFEVTQCRNTIMILGCPLLASEYCIIK